MKIIYSRGFPYGAPLFMLRGGGTKTAKNWLKERGFRWDGNKFCWYSYLDRVDAIEILRQLRDQGYEIVAKKEMDTNYLLDIDA